MSPFLKVVVQVTLSSVKCQLTVDGREVVPHSLSQVGAASLTPPEPDSPCPGQHSHTLWDCRAGRTRGHCRSHPELRCAPAQWILCLWGSLQGERTCHHNGLSSCEAPEQKVCGWALLEGCPFCRKTGLWAWKRGQGWCSG